MEGQRFCVLSYLSVSTLPLWASGDEGVFLPFLFFSFSDLDGKSADPPFPLLTFIPFAKTKDMESAVLSFLLFSRLSFFFFFFYGRLSLLLPWTRQHGWAEEAPFFSFPPGKKTAAPPLLLPLLFASATGFETPSFLSAGSGVIGSSLFSSPPLC